MTKKLLLIGVAALGLSGCVAVPVYDAPPPAYGYAYGPPAAAVTFGYYGPRHYYHDHRYGPRYRRY